MYHKDVHIHTALFDF